LTHGAEGRDKYLERGRKLVKAGKKETLLARKFLPPEMSHERGLEINRLQRSSEKEEEKKRLRWF